MWHGILLKAPRWVLILEAFLLVAALLVLAYKAAMWISPLSGLDKTPHARKVDPETQVLDYYRQYPESYIRLGKETWRYDESSGSAFHSFVLENKATIAYSAIRLQIRYESSGGKLLEARAIDIPGTLPALGSLEVKGIEVKHVPASAQRILVEVTVAKPAR